MQKSRSLLFNRQYLFLVSAFLAFSSIFLYLWQLTESILTLIALFGFCNAVIFAFSLFQCLNNNSFGRCHLALLGSFVWADSVIFSLFWFLLSVCSFLLNDVYLFFFAASVFWVVRSLGETIYWFCQQFSKINRNPVENFWMHKIFEGDSVWFVYQIIWQCVCVISIVASVYFGVLWVKLRF